jgi:hypothetical protein
MKECPLSNTKSVTFKVPGRPVPAVRTTQRQKHYSKQYQRYEAYKHIIRLSYWMAHIDWTLPFTQEPERTRIISEKRSMMQYRDALLEMIGTLKGGPSSYVEIKVCRVVGEKEQNLVENR